MIYKERADGPTPNGGSYSEIYYRDDDGNSADKDVATRFEIVEYDENDRRISSTYGFLKRVEKRRKSGINQLK